MNQSVIPSGRERSGDGGVYLESSPLVAAVARGGAYILGRQVLLRLFGVAANVCLARWLGPKVFGIYAVLSFIVFGPSSLVGVLGLNVALVRKPEPLREKDTSTVFWVQTVILLGIGLSLLLLRSAALNFYQLDPVYVWVLGLLFVALSLRTFRAVPAALLERKLSFGELSAIEVAESAAYYGVVLSLAYGGHGLWSFVWATLLKESIGLALLTYRSGWRPARQFDRAVLRDLSRVGLPYQAGGIFNLLFAAFPPLVIGSVLGATEVGYVGWAYTVALYPLSLAISLDRLWIPAYAKVQDEPARFVRAVEKTIRFNMLTVFPLTTVIVLFASEITRDVFGEKWLPGAFLLYFYAVPGVVSAVALPMNNAFISRGRTEIPLVLSAAWAIVTWAVGTPLTMAYGLLGWGCALVLAQLPSLGMFWYFAKESGCALPQVMTGPLSMAAVTAAVGLVAKSVAPLNEPFAWMLWAPSLVIFYFAGLRLLFGDGFASEAWRVWRAVMAKPAQGGA